MIGIGQNECLRIAAVQASANASWKEFANYIENRERGLRRIAFQHLESFLQASKSWPFNERKEFASWLCPLLDEFGSDGYGLTPQPLSEQLLVPTLREWAKRELTNSTPCRWLAFFFVGNVHLVTRTGLVESPIEARSLLREALKRYSSDESARIRLIEIIIGDAEFSCHHLPHYYIGEPVDDLAHLEEAVELLSHVANPTQSARLQSEMGCVKSLIEDWIAFKQATEADFNEWCLKRGRKYRWVKSINY
jgi:hypothetical protein